MKRLPMVLMVAVGLFCAVPDAGAQGHCYEQCDPFYSSCDEMCYECMTDYQDYSCPPDKTIWTTCGDAVGACLQANCTPSWYDATRTNVGTYGESTRGVVWSSDGSMYGTCGCDHHRVDIVTQRDANQCNLNSSYWQRQYCDDWVDDFKPQQNSGWFDCPDCCDPLICPPGRPCYFDYTFTCNDYHSCW
ncbi:MAG TPA: hypothetical protein VEO54_04700 [Thermoanaerobaculia bacterium]|nr:hypothetical protein [Thermoanaerobaculia bacterium]